MYEIAKLAVVGRIKSIAEYKLWILFFAFCSILHIADSRQGFSAILQKMFQDLQEMFREITRILISVKKIVKKNKYAYNYHYYKNSTNNKFKTKNISKKIETIKSTIIVDIPNTGIANTKKMILKKTTK